MIVICGPTAVGKTDLAIQLAKEYKGEIISADSRQVYKGMDIGTGKKEDFSSPSRGHGIMKSVIWGYDVVYPNEEWSPAQFAKMANVWIKDIQGRKKLPIIVGGDGFYLEALINPPQTLYIKPDLDLRKEAEMETVQQLQSKLKELNLERFNRMNWSDQNNSRRLIRAIEIAQVEKSRKKYKKVGKGFNTKDIIRIGLMVNADVIDKRIEERVKKRLKMGLENEVKGLVDKYGWNRTLMSTIAYKEWGGYFEGKETREEAVKNWTIHEKQYARKQITWFKKRNDIKWFDITSGGENNKLLDNIGRELL